ncbi:HAD family hydrolase [Pedobacter gandavensis]|uniref:HAD family hydrolase n=1 Tax=Pedobacter gandavensis TaxID=2679963 RepID=UPI00292EBFEE|nr:HAD family hydrolase [Pedobacter gandavensis]
MPFYKHYSFDLWLTLIKSNPAFKTERTKYFHARFNSKKKTIEEVALVFRQVDLMVNAINEKTGKNIDADEMYLMVISMINDYSTDFQEVDTEALYLEMETLLLNNMPLLYNPETFTVLTALKSSGLSTVNVLSNTGFIKGKTLRKVLSNLNLSDLLDFQLYSDELRLSKPNPEFFKLMLNTIDPVKHPEIGLHEVIHVGDNPIADVKGAKAMGIHTLLINSNDLLISHLLS